MADSRIDRDDFIAKTAYKRDENGNPQPITMPVETEYDIGERFKESTIQGGYKLISKVWYGIHNGKQIVFEIINRTMAKLPGNDDLVEVMRVERKTDFSFMPNGKKQETLSTYQRIPIPGLSENVQDLVPDQLTKTITKKFFYDQVNDADKYRYFLSQIVTTTGMLCVVNGKDAQGNPRDPYPVHLQLNGISFRVDEGVQTEFIEEWKVETQTFNADEIITAKHEQHMGVADIETSSMNTPPIELNLSEPCTPPYKQVKVVKGDKAGKTIKIENPNIIHTDEAQEMADTILKVNSWIKQIDRRKTYLGIIPIQVIGKSAGNVGYTIAVNHMEPSATTTISHREMIEDTSGSE